MLVFKTRHGLEPTSYIYTRYTYSLKYAICGLRSVHIIKTVLSFLICFIPLFLMNAWRDIIISHINYGTNKGHNVGMYIH